jgi:hypothetical protein
MKNRVPAPHIAPLPGVRDFIDFEFNGKGGDILSLAIVTDSGQEWYEVVEHDPATLVPWVVENVVPNLGKEPLPWAVFIESFEVFIERFGYIEFFYSAHADKRYLDIVLSKVKRLPLHRCIRDGFLSAAASEVPHNALADARTIVEFVCGSNKPRPELPGGPTDRDLFRVLWDKGHRYDARDVRVELVSVTSHEGKPYGCREQLEREAYQSGMSIYGLLHREAGGVFHDGRIKLTPVQVRSNASQHVMSGTLEIPFYFYLPKEPV